MCFCLGWFLSLLSIDLGETPQCLISGSDSEPGIKRGFGFPIDFPGISRFLSCLMDFFSTCYSNRFAKAYLLRDVTAQGAHHSVGPLSPQSKKLTCLD